MRTITSHTSLSARRMDAKARTLSLLQIHELEPQLFLTCKWQVWDERMNTKDMFELISGFSPQTQQIIDHHHMFEFKPPSDPPQKNAHSMSCRTALRTTNSKSQVFDTLEETGVVARVRCAILVSNDNFGHWSWNKLRCESKVPDRPRLVLESDSEANFKYSSSWFNLPASLWVQAT